MFTHEEIPSSGGKWITFYTTFFFFSCCFMIFGKHVNASSVLGLSSGNREKCCPRIFHVLRLNYGASRPFWSQPSNWESPWTYSFTKRQLTSTTDRPNNVDPHTWSISAHGEMPNKKIFEGIGRYGVWHRLAVAQIYCTCLIIFFPPCRRISVNCHRHVCSLSANVILSVWMSVKSTAGDAALQEEWGADTY